MCPDLFQCGFACKKCSLQFCAVQWLLGMFTERYLYTHNSIVEKNEIFKIPPPPLNNCYVTITYSCVPIEVGNLTRTVFQRTLFCYVGKRVSTGVRGGVQTYPYVESNPFRPLRNHEDTCKHAQEAIESGGPVRHTLHVATLMVFDHYCIYLYTLYR